APATGRKSEGAASAVARDAEAIAPASGRKSEGAASAVARDAEAMAPTSGRKREEAESVAARDVAEVAPASGRQGEEASARSPRVASRDASLTLAAFALVTALGAYTHYWFAFLTLAQLAGAVAVLRGKAWPLIAAAAAGWAPFLAWVPTLSAQLQNGS